MLLTNRRRAVGEGRRPEVARKVLLGVVFSFPKGLEYWS